MKPSKSRQWLQSILEGGQPSENDLLQLVADCPNEDQWLEYKSGKELAKETPKPNETLRQYVGGFSNADGGALVIGYDPPSQIFDAATAPGGGSLTDWAARATTPLAMTPPRFHTVRVKGLDVLVVAVPRSRSLVFCIEAGVQVWYYRFGDQTLPMPQPLVTDLLVGRRSEAQLRCDLYRAEWNRTRLHQVGPKASQMDLLIRLTLENIGLEFADDVRAGVVAWCLDFSGREAPSSLLFQSVEVRKPPIYGGASEVASWQPAHIRSSRFNLGSRNGASIDLGPFDEYEQESLKAWPIPIFHDRSSEVASSDAPADVKIMATGKVRLSAAIYVTARGCEPFWHQLSWTYRNEATGAGPEQLASSIEIRPLFSERPVVSIEFVP